MTSSNPHPIEHLTQLGGKTVIITGGAGGIGAATAKVFNLHGANVVIADVPSSDEAAQKLIASLPYPEKALFYAVDILNWEQMLGLFHETIRRFGSIDIIVANAGIMEKTDTLDIESTDENGNLLESTGAFNVIDVNVKGTLNTLRLAIHFMRPSPDRPAGRKSIVLVASTSGYFGGTGVAAYVSSKHAIIGLLRSSHVAASQNGVTVTAAGARWQADRLKPNTTEDVGMAIALSSVEGKSGSCTLVAGPHRKEMEASRNAVMPQWLGDEIHGFFQNAFKIISSSGGYNLPKASKI
ncbi:hypothetical protein BDV11DRAFT_206017 [Aspergillus similis]